VRHASAILVGSRHTQSEIPDRYRDKTIYIPENGIDPKRFSQTAQPTGTVLRACFVGRLVPYKGADMLISASADLLRGGRMTLDIIGDGPMLDQLTALATSLDCENGLTFHRWVPHHEVQSILSRSHLLSFPSIREFGGGVVLEAMALGVVPLIVDYAGPGELVSDDTGLKVPCGTRTQIIDGFRKTLTELTDDPDQLRPKAQAAQARIRSHFLWSCKAQQIRNVYDWILTRETCQKPDAFNAVSPHIAAKPA
jgi:glycosyltransferase involved in cell wall biosynthesis